MRAILATILLTLLVQGCSTPLPQAAAKGDKAAVEKMLKDGASVDQSDSLGRTALYFAAQKGARDIAKILLAKGANPTHRTLIGAGNTPMHVAALNGHDDVLELFFAADFSPDIRNRSYQTPLMLAAWARLPQTVALLLGHGANPGFQDANGWTALHANWNPKPNDPDYEDVMELILARKPNVNAVGRNPYGFTPLMSACQVGSLTTVRKLIEVGADVNARDENDETPYGIALHAHNHPLMEFLAQSGAITKKTFTGTNGQRNPQPIIPKSDDQPEPVEVQ